MLQTLVEDTRVEDRQGAHECYLDHVVKLFEHFEFINWQIAAVRVPFLQQDIGKARGRVQVVKPVSTNEAIDHEGLAPAVQELAFDQLARLPVSQRVRLLQMCKARMQASQCAQHQVAVNHDENQVTSNHERADEVWIPVQRGERDQDLHEEELGAREPEEVLQIGQAQLDLCSGVPYRETAGQVYD